MDLGNSFSGCGKCNEAHPRPINQCDNRTVTSITRAGDQIIITLSDCTFLRASPSVVDESVKTPADVTEITAKLKELESVVAELKAAQSNQSSNEALTARVTALEEKLKVLDNLEKVQDSNENPVFNALLTTKTGE